VVWRDLVGRNKVRRDWRVWGIALGVIVTTAV